MCLSVKKLFVVLLLSLLFTTVSHNVNAQPLPTRAFAVCETNNISTCNTPDNKEKYYNEILQKIINMQSWENQERNNCPINDPSKLQSGQSNGFYSQCWNDPLGNGISVKEQYKVLIQNQCACLLGFETESLYREDFQNRFSLYVQENVTGTPPPIPTTEPSSIPTPTPADFDLDKINKQLDEKICPMYEGAGCCLSTDVSQTQSIPDLTADAGISSNNLIARLWKRISEGLSTLVATAQKPANNVLNDLTYISGPCRPTSDPLTGDLIELKPYLWSRNQLVQFENTDENVYNKLGKLYAEIPKLGADQRQAKMREIRTLIEGGGYSCQCNEPSDTNPAIPKTLSPASQAMATSPNSNILGASDGSVVDEVDYFFPPSNIQDSSFQHINQVINYCNALDDTELKVRFRTEDRSECTRIMGSSLAKARRLCTPLITGSTDPEEFNNCYKCTGYEDGVWTAIGCIYSDFGKTVSKTIFGVVLGIAGLVTFGCLLYASFLLQTSAGNPEKTSKAQEMMTACITGLIMIIFSVFILRVIGVDILRIPGFSTSTSATPTSAVPAPGAAAPTTVSAPSPTAVIVAAASPTRIVTPGAMGPAPGTINPSPTNGVSAGTPIPPTNTTTPVPSPTSAVLSPFDCNVTGPGPNEVHLYDETNFKGSCMKLDSSNVNFAQIDNSITTGNSGWNWFGRCNSSYNDCIASVQLGSNVRQVILYHEASYDIKDANTSAWEYVLTASTATLPARFTDTVSSVIVALNP